MFCYSEDIKKIELGEGIFVQELGHGTNMNVLHWDMVDGSVVPLHEHVQEQFGYVIKGGFEILIGEESNVIRAGDAYYIPPNVKHSFHAIGDTEAIDIFNPIKTDFPWNS